MFASKDNNRSNCPDKLLGTGTSNASPVDVAVVALARLLGRQAAREAFEAARSGDRSRGKSAGPFPASTTDIDTEQADA